MPTKPFSDPEIDQLRTRIAVSDHNFRAAVCWSYLLILAALVSLAWKLL